MGARGPGAGLLAALVLGPALAAAAPPTGGLADLHLHQWGEQNFDHRWHHGAASGPVAEALAPGEDGGGGYGDGAGGRRQDGVAAHGVVGLAGRFDTAHGRLGRRMTQALGVVNTSDDTAAHAPAGPSSWPLLPHWLGWPTSDSIAHQQVWEGWLRLAHDGMPLLWHLRRRVLVLDEDGESVAVRCRFLVRSGLDAAACDTVDQVPVDELTPAARGALLGAAIAELRGPLYAATQRSAAAAGHGGLQLAVVSLVHFRPLCSVLVPPEDDRAVAACEDTPNVLAQAASARAWAAENADWVVLARSPADVRRAWEGGRLAVVLGVEASDIMDDPDVPVAVQLDALVDAGVRLIQPVHELDHRFGGAAPINPAFDVVQAWRTRADPRVAPARDPAAPGYARRRAQHAEHWERQATRASSPFGHGLLRFGLSLLFRGAHRGFTCGGPGARDPSCFDRKGRWRGLPNRHGLTDEGRELLELMLDRGVLLDLAHLSHAAISDALDWLPPALPLLHSHALPASALAHPTEHHQTPALLDRLAARGGMVGLRPSDDPLAPQLPGAAARLLDRADCGGTAVGVLAAVEALAADHPGLGLAWGSDLNGFINQVGPTGQLRRPALPGQLPCPAVVPGTGSSVQRRGLAHVGLLPALTAELAAIEATLDAPAAREGLGALGWGAERFVRLWERQLAVVAGQDALPGPPPLRALPAPAVSPGWELPVPVRLAGGGEATVSLPLLAAIEGLLPYVDAAGAGAGWVQLPTTRGLELGVDTPVRQLSTLDALGLAVGTGAAARDARRAQRQGGVDARLYGGAWGRSFMGPGTDFVRVLDQALGDGDRVPAGEWSAATLALRRCAVDHAAALAACVDDPRCLAAAPERVPAGRPAAALSICGEGGGR